MLHQTFLFLGQLWQLFEVSQILEFLRYLQNYIFRGSNSAIFGFPFLLKGVNSKRKEIAPLEAKAFLNQDFILGRSSSSREPNKKSQNSYYPKVLKNWDT